MKGASEDGQKPRQHMLPGFSREGAKVLLRRLQASAIDDDDRPTTIRTMTVPPHHLCCHTAAQVVVAWPGWGTTVACNNQQPTRMAQQEAAAPENVRQRHWQTQEAEGQRCLHMGGSGATRGSTTTNQRTRGMWQEVEVQLEMKSNSVWECGLVVGVGQQG